MTRDPFDHMKKNNPVPPDMVPSAPMTMADRIVGARTGAWPGWAITLATATAVFVIGLGSLWMVNRGDGDEVAGGETTTTATSSTETTAVPTTTTAPVVTTTMVDAEPVTVEGVVYFFQDLIGEGWTDGPFLIPVAVPIEVTPGLTADLALLEQADRVTQRLLAGTAPFSDSSQGLSSAIPVGTTTDGFDVSVEEGLIGVHLSGEFVSGGGTFSMTGRLAQVVYTLTAIDGIDGVVFYVDGEPTTVFGGEGIIVPSPATRADFAGSLPAVFIETPAYGGEAGNPLVATGSANVFEATVSLALTDADGLIIWEGFTNATCGTGCRGDWEISIPYEVDTPQMGSLIAWESSARDGSQTNVREHRVWLVPSSGETTTCSGSLVTDTLVPQPGLSPQDAEMRSRIFYAATACDWDTLRSLQIEGFRYSFGENVDAVTYWQGLEASGEQPMLYLAELLNRPYGTQPSADQNLQYYVWPSVFTTEWSLVSDKEIDELRPLYDDEDFAGFADFGGYYGYRVGIIDGSWVYFVAGD